MSTVRSLGFLTILLAISPAYASLPPTPSSNRISSVFVRLSPEYLPSDGTSCSVVKPQQRAVLPHSYTLSFYSMRGEMLEIVVRDSEKPNAYTLRGESRTIVITRGLLDKLENASELAFVLAHELAHLEHRHFPAKVPGLLLSSELSARIARTHRNWELLADREAQAMLAEAGFSLDAAGKLLARLESFEDSFSSTGSSADVERNHPRTAARIAALRGLSQDEA